MNQSRHRSANRRRQQDRRRRRWRFDLESVMCLVAAVVLIVIAYYELEDMYLLQHRGQVVSATVLEESGGKHPRITVRYTTVAGEVVTGDTSNYVDADAGQTIQVVYDPERPSRMQAADWGFDYWIPCVMFGLVIVLFVYFGIAGLRS